MFTRVVEGRARVVREIRAAAPLLSRIAAPTTARGPWLAAALHAAPVPAPRVRHRAVVVEADQQGRPVGAALLSSVRTLRSGRPVTVVRLLGDGPGAGIPVPPGTPPRRLPVTTPDVADLLAEGVLDLLDRTRGAWELELTGLPLGDPTLAALAARLGVGAGFRTTRSRLLVDELDDVGPVRRSCDPAELERWLPTFLLHRPAGSRPAPLRAVARVHAATGRLEHAVLVRAGRAVAGLLTVLEDDGRHPWWGFSEVGGLGGARGRPWVSLRAASWQISR